MSLRVSILLCWMGMGLISGLFAQATSPVLLEGILEFENEKYRKSIQTLGILINSQLLEEKELPKAHYFLGQAYLGLVRSKPKFRKKYPLAVARAYTHTHTAEVLNKGGRYADLAGMAAGELQDYLYNEGVYYFNQRDFSKADYYFIHAAIVNPRDYDAILGSSFIAVTTQDTSRAVEIWEEIMETYTTQEPDTIPVAIFKALSLLGKVQPRLLEVSTLTPIKKIEKFPFPKAIILPKEELKVYQGKALKQEEAARLFEDVLRNFPEDVKTALAYAELLQYQDKDEKAMDLYRQVLFYDSLEMKAHKHLAVYHLNEAVKVHRSTLLMQEVNHPAMQEEVELQLRKAYPHFKLLHEKDPEGGRWIEPLFLIGKQLGKSEADEYGSIREGQNE